MIHSANKDRVSYEQLNREQILLVPYQPNWPAVFERESRLLTTALGECIGQIAHIGSTAVSGLVSKPVIDIAIGTRCETDLPWMLNTLALLEYVFYPEFEEQLPDRSLLIKRNLNGDRSHQIIVMARDSQYWQNYLDFRDDLIGDAELSMSYGKMKRSIAQRYPNNRMRYSQEKTAFIQACLQEYRAKPCSE